MQVNLKNFFSTSVNALSKQGAIAMAGGVVFSAAAIGQAAWAQGTTAVNQTTTSTIHTSSISITTKARLLIDKHLEKAAIKLLSSYICTAPGDLPARRMLVEAMVGAGYCKAAAKEMQGLVKAGMRSADDFRLLADAYRYCGEAQNAIRNYQEALNIEPQNATAQNGLALTYSQAGDYRTASAVLRRALSQTTLPQSRKLLFSSLAEVGRSEQSARATQTAMSQSIESLQ